MKYYRVLFIGITLFCSCLVNAAQYASSTSIDNVRVRHGIVYVKFSGCTRYSRIYLNTEYAKAMYSTALTAGISKKNVSVEFDGDDCSSSELEITYLDLKF